MGGSCDDLRYRITFDGILAPSPHRLAFAHHGAGFPFIFSFALVVPTYPPVQAAVDHVPGCSSITVVPTVLRLHRREHGLSTCIYACVSSASASSAGRRISWSNSSLQSQLVSIAACVPRAVSTRHVTEQQRQRLQLVGKEEIGPLCAINLDELVRQPGIFELTAHAEEA